ncbi:MAG: hypothetical protein ABIN08_18425 [Caldimonas sp.]
MHRYKVAAFARICAVITGLVTGLAAGAQDWSTCANDLDYLRRRSDDASSAAKEADEAKQKFEREKEEFETCRRFPQSYDLYRDGCRSKRADAESALSQYKSSVSEVASKLSDVDSKVRSVASSCASDVSAVLGPPPKVPDGVANPQLCRTVLGFRDRLPTKSLIALCSQHMSVEECNRCMGK